MIRYIQKEDKNKLSNNLLDLKNSKLLKIKNIYLGLKISDSDKDTIIKIVRDNLKNIKIFKMTADIAINFDMDYEEIIYK
jgi:hypothetical protein